jgi:hypothetical protein
MKLLLILLGVLALTACSGNETETAAAPANEETPAPAADPQAQAEQGRRMALQVDLSKLDEAWMTAYTAVQEALAADDFETAKTAMANLAEQSPEGFDVLAGDAASLPDIAALRTAFKPISERLVEANLPAGFALAYCPMAFNDTGAHWVQKNGEIMNPYFGAEMLHCGGIRKVGGEGEQ